MITVSSVDTKDNTSEPFDQLAALQQSAGKLYATMVEIPKVENDLNISSYS